ncbi:MAG: adenylyltransferase/cytidyltransferase family protein, partial [Clostridia bacterium]|nr:adenylyltransferase/cytidyltransferase family protein [Clostridia bacterium]
MMENTKKKCIFAGSFDPPTLGHKAVVDDCLQMFDEVVLAVMVNPSKTPCFSVDERLEMLRLEYGKQSCVRIITFQGTVAELLQKENTKIYVRGIRNGTDLDFENDNFYASKKLDKDLIA